MTAVHNSLRNSRQYSDTGDSDEFTETSQYLSEIEIEEHNVDHHTFSSVNDDEFTLLRSNEKLPAVATPDQKYSRTKVDAGHEGAGTQQLPMVAQVLTTVRKSLLTCQAFEELEILERERERYKAGTDENEKGKEKEGVRGRVKEGKMDMDIGWPTDVEHVAHVTFDRYNGFLGLPKEYENEVPRPTPSASKNVFGVSAESMQCSFDSQGNMVPTILLLLQKRLYDQHGLKAEGIFRINPENSHEEHVREQLNKGIVPTDIDIHALAGLIKAWFRELPKGVLDALGPDQVLACHGEKDTFALVKKLPPTEAALLDWAINLMADVVEEEASNKMNARNIAMVFAPNMTQMADPLTALMHAVQVMNLLKTLILRTLRNRKAAPHEVQSPPSSPGVPDMEEPEHNPQAALWVEDAGSSRNDLAGSLYNRHDRQWSQTSSTGLLNGHDRTSSQCSTGGVWMGHDRSGSQQLPPLPFLGVPDRHISHNTLFNTSQSTNPFLSSQDNSNLQSSFHAIPERKDTQSEVLNTLDSHGSHCEEPQGNFSPFLLFPPTNSFRKNKGVGGSGRLSTSIDQRSERVEAW